ncbi:GNAT family N-acetyltransferase [Undibacterium sp. SXout20W]|uniref:GNAT family N-acetyltransferase n=1 Tax=Undibacterium sp. SXout20W TaxID=3413051 RepID=UPI003BF0D77C
MHVNTVFPNLNTQRLHLRRITDADKGQIFKAMSDEYVVKHLGCSYETLAEAQTLLDWYELIFHHEVGIWWGICLYDAPAQLIGACGIHDWDRQQHSAELAFWLLPEHWRKGYMKESLYAVMTHCFSTLLLHRLQARVDAGNSASQTLLLQCGFQQEGILRDAEFRGNEYFDVFLYARLATDPRV